MDTTFDNDRNFDDLAQRFEKNIYGGLKGDIRLAVLARDCAACLPIAPFATAPSSTSWRVLDAGGGQGQFSLPLAGAGHDLVLCDISSEMLALARRQVEETNVQQRVQLIHSSIQNLREQLLTNEQFDLVICHAVMEWMHDPESLLPLLLSHLKPGGFLSLIFYNMHALIYKNLLRTNFSKIKKQQFRGAKGSLTPINPLLPADVLSWAQRLPLKLRAHSGIRVFHDYIFDAQNRERDPASLLQMELQFSQQEPYRSLGRYIHLLLQRDQDF